MHRIFIILLFVVCSISLKAQNISIIRNGYFHNLDVTCNLNYDYCPQKAGYTFAYHPAGYLVKIRTLHIDPPKFLNDSVFLYKYDPFTCSETLLYSFKQYNFFTNGSVMSIDYLGRIYIYNQRNNSIYRTNSYGDTLTLVRPFNDQMGDIIFAKEFIYIFSINNQKIYQLDTNFNIINNVRIYRAII